MNCKACGIETPRLRTAQRYCPQCEARIAETIRKDDERRRPRVYQKDFTGTTPL